MCTKGAHRDYLRYVRFPLFVIVVGVEKKKVQDPREIFTTKQQEEEEDQQTHHVYELVRILFMVLLIS